MREGAISVKKSKPRSRREELTLAELKTKATDAGLIVAKISPDKIGALKEVLPEREWREFRALVDGMHRHFRRFRDQSQA